ncbi:hypothetical protein RH831_10710 [Halodesulfurarchaeum sp. HSR-GB]|nr:hypothetical protein [Halodesulfurarchaeum sp. HSR-GB]MDR5657646.1 hypothetical protein [Halodesulfurarchaeum sp. HSR-GB]
MEQFRFSRETREIFRRLAEAAEVIARELERYNDRQEESDRDE